MGKKRIHELIDKNMGVIQGDEKYNNGSFMKTHDGNQEIYNKMKPAPDIYGIQYPGSYRSYGSQYIDTGDRMRGYDGDEVDDKNTKSNKKEKINDIPDADPSLMFKDIEEEFTLEDIKKEHPQVARLAGLFVDRINATGLESQDLFTLVGVLLDTLNVKDLPSYYKKRLMGLMIKNSLTDSKN